MKRKSSHKQIGAKKLALANSVERAALKFRRQQHAMSHADSQPGRATSTEQASLNPSAGMSPQASQLPPDQPIASVDTQSQPNAMGQIEAGE
jgi:hypothetical protein